MQARGCESVTQDVMAEVISPAGAKFLRKLSFNSWHTVPERRTDRAREHSCPQSNPAVSLNLCHRGSTKNDPESNSKESQQVEASNRGRDTGKQKNFVSKGIELSILASTCFVQEGNK